MQKQDQWGDQTTNICACCLHFVDKVDQKVGRCRRHAPLANGGGWPVVYPTDWCGDHKLILPEPVQSNEGGRKSHAAR